MNIKVQSDEGCFPLITDNGDLIDLYNKETITLTQGQYILLDLGVRMQIPKGFKANVYPRSSTFNKYGIMLANSVGQIDSTYCGPDDVWKAPVIAMRDTIIPKEVRICQFEIVPSMFSNIFQKLKWLLFGKVRLTEVKKLKNKNRDGFGSSGN